MNDVPYNPFGLLAKLLEHPDGRELANIVFQLHKDMQADAQPDPLLKRTVVSIAKSKNKHTPRHVNNMTNAELQEWIDKNS
jgi:hypothetical protein